MLKTVGYGLLGSLILLTACSSSTGTVSPSPDIRGLATVEEVDILILTTSEPPQIGVDVRGFVGDPCTRLQEPIITSLPETRSFTVTLETLRPADVVCIQMLAPFEISFRLPMTGLPRGAYTVSVNGVSEPFFY
ncbi:MAG: hypothetical protein Q6L60_06450 [Thermostichus sp. HHBFW_bins_43]